MCLRAARAFRADVILYVPWTSGTPRTFLRARILQLLAPISPHIAEEIYQIMYTDDKKHESIHVSPWSLPQKEIIDEEKPTYF